ncbi:MAG: lasso peptide [Nostoc sp. TH1S01]|nr:lasso peptide [Nostoc sp. TH1S01]
MKKTYSAPKLTNHGSVNEVTAVTQDSARQDTLFGPPGGTTVVSNDQGSLDSCIISPGTTNCL